MKRIVLRLHLFLLPLALSASTAAHAEEPAAKGLEGQWLGTLKVGPQELRLAVKLTKKPDGALSGTLNSLDQGGGELPIEEVTLKDDTLLLNLKKIGAAFEGKLNKERTEAAGEWKQSKMAFPITFKKVDKLPAAGRPQEPKKPYPYDDEEVAYENKKGGVKLAGTLTKPRGAGPFPAVLLITGSGAQDRDETILGHKPFKVIADHLTRKGIAVLRVDDRGVGGSTGKTADSTTADFVEDVLAGVEYLKNRKEINPKQIGLLGHSEGGIIAPLAAAQSPDVAFIVLLAGTGLPGEDILYLQGAALLKLMGASEEALKRQRELQEAMFAVVKQEKDPAVVEKKLKEAIASRLSGLSEEEKKLADAQKGQIEQQIRMVRSPWFRYFLTYDPRPALQKVQCPVLALIGEKDFQVPPKENLPELEKALKAGGNKDYTVKELAGLNHLFQTCKTGALAEYGQIEETMAPAALETIAEWILKRMPRQ